MNPAVNLRKELLRQEQWTPNERTHYEKEIAQMIKIPLTPVTTVLTATGCILGLVSGIALGCLFVQEDVPLITSIALGAMSVGGFSMVAYCASILVRGGRSRVRHGLWLALHLATLSTLFLVMALVKISVAGNPGGGTEILALASILQWIFFAVLPLALWFSQMRALEQRQHELMALIQAQQTSAKQ